MSEVFLGAALQKYPRDSYYLADKFNLQAKPDFRAQFDEQLTRLNTDAIDFYLPMAYKIRRLMICCLADVFNRMRYLESHVDQIKAKQ